MDLAAHPLYHSDATVADETAKHVAAGRTVFQLWLTAPDEREHSAHVLRLLEPHPQARVLSLGCGVAGMEAHWAAARPDLRFTLVNRSQAQLDLCRCPGRRVVADVASRALRAEVGGGYDIVVCAYVLGHVEPERVLLNAIAACKRGGLVLVLDVFDASPDFQAGLMYLAPTMALMELADFQEVECRWHLAPNGVAEAELPGWLHEADPRLWLRRV